MASVMMTTGRNKIVSRSVVGSINLETDTIEAMLVGTGYNPAATEDFVDGGFVGDPADNEISVTNYTPGFSGTGRKALSGKSVAPSDALSRCVFDASDLTWASLGAGATVRYVVLYKRGTADTDSQLIAALQLPADTATDGSNFVVSFPASGVLNF